MNNTPISYRVHIGIFGRTNAGKSSLLNALTAQNIAIVSPTAGTTTDPVHKTMELAPLGAVVFFDTAGLDDTSELGQKRLEKTYAVLSKTDIAVVVTDGEKGRGAAEEALERDLKKRGIPYVSVINKIDIADGKTPPGTERLLHVSAVSGAGIPELLARLAELKSNIRETKPIVSDLIGRGDIIVLVTPIDEVAPKGRLILPQQQTIREILDTNAVAVVAKDTELSETLAALKNPPELVITDSQVFKTVAETLPKEIPLTSFSILFARHKGDLNALVQGAEAVKNLRDGDRILVSEGCTHQRQCGDIGSVKIPKMLRAYTKIKNLEFDFTSGGDFSQNLSQYKLIVHCGGCMLNGAEMKRRIKDSGENAVPIVNYGVLLAELTGILDRSLEPLRGENSEKN